MEIERTVYWYIKVDYETIFFYYCSAVTTYSSSSVWSISSPEQQVAVGAVSEAKKKKRRFSREGNPKLWGVYIDVLRCFSFPSTISKFVFFFLLQVNLYAFICWLQFWTCVTAVERTVISEKNIRPTQATLQLLFVLRQKTQKLKHVSFIRL